MTLRLTFVMVVVTGCAAGLQTVPKEEMQNVPAAEQARIDTDHATEVARVDAEQRTAQAGVASARRELAAFHRHAQPAPVVAAPGDEWATAMRAQDTARRTALTEVDAATEAWLHARVDYHQQVLDHATAERATLHCSRELTRAKAVDHHLLGSDTYDTAPYRAQLAGVQQRWYAAEVRRNELQVALQRASIRLATAKDAYAAVLMKGPTAPTSSDPRATFVAWNPAAERKRNHRLHLVRAAANVGPVFLTPPARVARK